MSSVKKEILKKINYILENEADETILVQLREELANYEARVVANGVSMAEQALFSEKEIREINEGYERSKNPENLIPHNKVMEHIWKDIGKYSGKA
ncbi:hypothetical protein [Owenweeksia hongkongensis]|uniref:hypothetical protein n=1 Tax=Owenweeksia hongkongensis TaxID=253245 RepID=UPI003A9313E5